MIIRGEGAGDALYDLVQGSMVMMGYHSVFPGYRVLEKQSQQQGDKMNIRKHRILFLLFAIILAVGPIPVQAFADDAYDRPGKSIAEYQAVLDRLNEEYGVESYITDQEMVDQITANLINSYGYLPFTPRVVTLEVLQQCTLKEFEAEVIANFNGYSIMAQRAGSDQPAELESGSRQDSGIISPAPNRGYYWAYIISPNPYGETSQLAATKDGNGKFNSVCNAWS